MVHKKNSIRKKLIAKNPLFVILLGAVIVIIAASQIMPALEYKPQCRDGKDNDGDGAVDFAAVEDYSGDGPVPGDLNCENPDDEWEMPMTCGDGRCTGQESCSNCHKDCGRCPP